MVYEKIKVLALCGYALLCGCLDWQDPELPCLQSITASSCSGAQVVIKGRNFGASQGDSTVSFNGTAAPEVMSWADGEIRVVVPAGATGGGVVVTVAGQQSNALQLTLQGIGRLTDFDESPTLIRDSTGRLHVFYFTSSRSLIHRYMMDGGSCWSAPAATLTSGGLHGYRVIAGPAGKLHLGYDDGSVTCFYRGYNLTTPGSKPRTWSREMVIATKRCSLGALLVDHSGSLLAFWSGIQAACGVQKFDETHGSWGAPVQVMIGWYIKAVATAGGVLHAVARTGTPADEAVVRHTSSSDGGKTWSPITILSNTLTAVTAPEIAATRDGTVHVVFGGKNSDGSCDVYHTQSKQGLSWPTESKLSDTSTRWGCGASFQSDPASAHLVASWGDASMAPGHTLFNRMPGGKPAASHELLTMGEGKDELLITLAKLHQDHLEFARLNKKTGKLRLGSIPVGKYNDMVYIPGGAARMGSKSGEADQQPEHMVQLSPYYLDRFEVSNKQYRTCVSAQQCTPPQLFSSHLLGQYWNAPGGTHDDYPVIYVDWNQATAYCKWAGKQLPTEAQWERAARGDWNGKYPWGNKTPDCTIANYYGSPGGVDAPCNGDPVAVNSLKPGVSFTGAYHLAGNVAEWVSDWFGAAYYKSSPARDPTGPAKGTSRVMRGGGWRVHKEGLVNTFRLSKLPDSSSHDLGFRCARSIP